MTGIAIVFALLGPFGTYEAMTLTARFFYWFVLLAAADLCIRLTHRIVERFGNVSGHAGRLAQSAVCFTLLFSPTAWGLSSLFDGGLLDWRGFTIFAANICALSVVMAVLTYFFWGTYDGPQPESRARLYDRLPVGTSASIMRLTVDDHYVDVYLDDGNQHRVLMRLTDAIREMDGAPGFCTHRSHWVSANHITRGVKQQNREFVVLADGTQVPVSKTYREDVLAAGFL
ncbi:MAG: LytTR family DNA-binding domain-containing protein [Pseudomonadota bacterium]